MRHLIYLVVFLTGFAALVFETLWFRQAGLAFGNSLWSATLVLSSFMGGLALGNGLVLRFGRRIRRPVSTYAVLEVMIAGTGLLIVLVLPAIGAWLAPVFRPLMDDAAVLNLLRLAIAFASLMVPATAMGATLPVLVQAVSRRDDNFGRVLGRLYGWNTLGATAGVLAAELYLVRELGIHGAAVAAALLGTFAVLIVLNLRKTLGQPHAAAAAGQVREADSLGMPVNIRGRQFLLAAFLSGMTMLGLEVLWFRFLLLFQPGTSLVFAVMLATVLCGIALGGIVAARIYGRNLPLHRGVRLIAGLSALLVAASYAVFPRVQSSLLVEFGATGFERGFVAAAIFLMLPVSFASGVMFTALGRAFKEEAGDGVRATAWLTLANTAGAMLGSMATGFILLPVLGVEMSLFIMIVLYGLTALLLPRTESDPDRTAFARNVSVAAVFLLSVIVFPFGLMTGTFLGETITQRFPDAKTVAVREGLTETAIYLEYERLGQPYYYRLLTNSYSMSTTNEQSMRYMKLFVYLPVAVRPDPKSALLISYGIGNTAKALTETDSLQSIAIVDISRSLLELSEIVYPDPDSHPLNDGRVEVHVEDGRFFLQVTDKRFDLITSEPPPPTIAGVVNLYTREYFSLIRDRLAPGGVASYWLPGHSLEEGATMSVIKAFCNVFADCSLWAGAGLDWILLGTREAPGAVGPESFSSQWDDPKVAGELRAIGVENPFQLGALFMADADDLAQVTEDALPVVDAFPYRIVLPYSGSREVPPLYAWLMDTARASRSFAESEFVERHWPPELVSGTLPYFSYQQLINQRYAPWLGGMPSHATETLRRILVETDLESLPLWMLGSNYYEQRLVEDAGSDPSLATAYELGRARRAIAERRFSDAMQHLRNLSNTVDPATATSLERLSRFVAGLADQQNSSMAD
jgi:spermidine synthase